MYDYIVIGSGFGGSVASLRLVEKGYKVLTLEQGKRYNPSDFPMTNRNLPRYLWVPALRFFGFQKLTFFRKASILSGVGVGGGSLVYANTLYMPPDAFFEHGDWAHLGNWKETLAEFYRKASFMLGRVKYNKINAEDRILREVADDLEAGKTFDSVHVGVNLSDPDKEEDPYFGGIGPVRKGCVECAGCMVGCRENAKNTLDRNYLWFAEKMGLELLPETKAERITFRDGVYTVETRGVTSWLRRKRTFSTRGIILAGGTLGTLKLLLKQKYRYGTLPLLSDRLGYQVRTNAETLCAVSGASQKMNNGLAITSVFSPNPHTHVEIVKYPDRSDAMKWFFGLSVPGARNSLERSWKLLVKTMGHPRRVMRILLSRNWPGSMVIFLVMQTVDNAMKLTWKNSLLGGCMRIDNRGQKRVPAYIPVGQEVMERYARKVTGVAQNILLEVFFDRPTTAHILGGCPMAATATEGVVDTTLKVHGYPEMYVADGSVVQGNIGVNPSLTIAALSEYAMSGIPARNGSIAHEYSEKLNILEQQWIQKQSGKS
jgi:cholesterol oxidase